MFSRIPTYSRWTLHCSYSSPRCTWGKHMGIGRDN